jgi:hypothetical protein
MKWVAYGLSILFICAALSLTWFYFSFSVNHHKVLVASRAKIPCKVRKKLNAFSRPADVNYADDMNNAVDKYMRWASLFPEDPYVRAPNSLLKRNILDTRQPSFTSKSILHKVVKYEAIRDRMLEDGCSADGKMRKEGDNDPLVLYNDALLFGLRQKGKLSVNNVLRMNTILRGVINGSSAINIPGGHFFHNHTVDFTLHDNSGDLHDHTTEPWQWTMKVGDFKSRDAAVMEKTRDLFRGKWKAFAVPFFANSGELKGMWPPRRGRTAFQEMLSYYHNEMARIERERKGGNHMFREKFILIVALAYHFGLMHPFHDGNGRVGILILQLELLRHGFYPAMLCRTDPFDNPMTILAWEHAVLKGIYAFVWTLDEYEKRESGSANKTAAARPYHEVAFKQFAEKKMAPNPYGSLGHK